MEEANDCVLSLRGVNWTVITLMEKEIEIIEKNTELTISIPRRGNWLVIAITGAWCFSWLCILIPVLRDGLLFEYSGFIWPIAGFSLVWIFVLKTFLWHVRGKEKITLDNEHLRINKVGTFLTSTRKYELSLVDAFSYTETSNVPWWSNLYGFAGGHISFDYWDRPEYFGQTIGRTEATKIVSRLNERLSNIQDLKFKIQD